MQFADIINTTGVSFILLAFILLTLKKIESNAPLYNLMNLLGAALACYGSYLINAIPFVILEGIWGFVALMGLIRNFKKPSFPSDNEE